MVHAKLLRDSYKIIVAENQRTNNIFHTNNLIMRTKITSIVNNDSINMSKGLTNT